jgi:predicted MPP superfamily phosphohydrolase
MRRIAWSTDIHLDFTDPEGIDRFCSTILTHHPDAVLLGGDTGEAPTVAAYLQLLEDRLQRPIYFVLGNHDFYQSSIATVRRRAADLTQHSRWLGWLPKLGIVPLTSHTCLIGHDGWSDGRFGDFKNSSVWLNDYLQIEELRALTQNALQAKLNALGNEAANFLGTLLPRAFQDYSQVILLTHVPPFQEACLYRGQPGDKNWLPHFTCKAVGDVLVDIMGHHPKRRLTVLCGHTHHAATVQVLPNLFVKTGEADYGNPQWQTSLDIE